MHAVATSLIFDRVSSERLPDDKPQQSLASCDVTTLMNLSDNDHEDQEQMYKLIAGHILCEYIPAFSFLKDFVMHIDFPMEYKSEMQEESVIVPFHEVAGVLDQLETWIHEIYAQAGKISLDPYEQNSQTQISTPISHTSNPDQPLSYIHPALDPNDPLAHVKVPVYGDQLSRVRLVDAKHLRGGCHTARDRNDHVYPVKCCKRSFMKVVYAFELS